MLPLPLSDSGTQGGHRPVQSKTDARQTAEGFRDVLSRQSVSREPDATSREETEAETSPEDVTMSHDINDLDKTDALEKGNDAEQFSQVSGVGSAPGLSTVRASDREMGAMPMAGPQPGSRVRAEYHPQGITQERGNEASGISELQGEPVKPTSQRATTESTPSFDPVGTAQSKLGGRDSTGYIADQNHYDIRQLAESDRAVPRSVANWAKLAEVQAEVRRASEAPEVRRAHDTDSTGLTPLTTDRHISVMAVSGPTTPQAPILMARQAVGQVAFAVSTNPDGVTEIALNPEELGRVRLRLTAHEGAITLHVQSERPETTDLLRRHIDVLAQEFQALGYDTISFSFGDQGQGASPEQSTNESSKNDTFETEVFDGPVMVLERVTTGLDLRI